MNLLGICIARDGQKRCCWHVLKAKLGFLAELEAILYADHVRFDLAHPYISVYRRSDIIIGERKRAHLVVRTADFSILIFI